MARIRHKFKHYFIPHLENDHKPQILRFHTVAAVCLVMLLAETVFIIGPTYLINRSRLFGIIVTNALVDGTNQARAADGLPVLHINPLLQAAAQLKANDMAANGYFAHTSPSGLSPWYWFNKVGYNFSAAGENLAVNFSDSQDVTNAWMNSPEHRANILNGNYTEIGMATATGTYEGATATFVVEELGEPAVAVVPSQVIVATATPKPAPVAALKPAVISAAPVLTVQTAAATGTEAVPSSVAVKGAATQEATPTATATVVQSATQAPVPAVPLQNNPIQNAVAAPRSLANDFYLFIIGLFMAALALDIFIKVRIQYPQLIFGGVAVIALAAMLIVLNQYGALTNLRIG